MTNAEKTILRNAFARYKASEGCSCCRDDEAHEAALDILAPILGYDRYSDDSGWDVKRDDQLPFDQRRVPHAGTG